jgi:pimeloyl-ACP methyl ester carboxylesterase
MPDCLPIPYSDFGGSGAWLHFAHANGYPPGAYLPLIEFLSAHYHVLAMQMRPLWPATAPQDLQDWRILSTDMARFFDQQNLEGLIGAGHSMGATTTLRLALEQPDRFSALVLIDPVFFPPLTIRFWDLIYRLGLAYHVHPLVRGALHRKQHFAGREAMFVNYRKKTIFKNIDDASLWAYVESLAQPDQDGQVKLAYQPAWEARIYATGLRADMDIWRNLEKLKPPVLIIRGSQSDAFHERTVRRIQEILPASIIRTIPNASHLVPMEYPYQTYQIIHTFLEAIFSSPREIEKIEQGKADERF